MEVSVATLLAGGHLLIEDIPGVGKTLLAQVLARSVGGTFHRIQGTSDLLPGDITGSMVPSGQLDVDGMRFRPGPVFANIVVFDELNRATPRTQSALLELAEESTVTVDGVCHRLPDPFMLVATQNPIDIAGTYGLGEGALDRFHAVITPGRASAASEVEVLTGRRGRSMLDAVEPVATLDDLITAREVVATVQIDRRGGVVRRRAARRDTQRPPDTSRRVHPRRCRDRRARPSLRCPRGPQLRHRQRRGACECSGSRSSSCGLRHHGGRRPRDRGHMRLAGRAADGLTVAADDRTRPVGLSPGAGAFLAAWIVAGMIARLTGTPVVIALMAALLVTVFVEAAAGWWVARRIRIVDGHRTRSSRRSTRRSCSEWASSAPTSIAAAGSGCRRRSHADSEVAATMLTPDREDTVRVDAVFDEPGVVTTLHTTVELAGPFSLIWWRNCGTVDMEELPVAPVPAGGPPRRRQFDRTTRRSRGCGTREPSR